MQQFFSLLSWRLFTAQHVSGVFPPIIRSSMTAVAASGFTFVSWWYSCCVRGLAGLPAGQTTNTWTLLHLVGFPMWIFPFFLHSLRNSMLIILILCESINTVKKEADTLLVASRNIGLEANGEETTFSLSNIYLFESKCTKDSICIRTGFRISHPLCPVLKNNMFLLSLPQTIFHISKSKKINICSSYKPKLV